MFMKANTCKAETVAKRKLYVDEHSWKRLFPVWFVVASLTTNKTTDLGPRKKVSFIIDRAVTTYFMTR